MRMKRRVLEINRIERGAALASSSLGDYDSSVLAPKAKWRTIVLNNEDKIKDDVLTEDEDEDNDIDSRLYDEEQYSPKRKRFY